VRHPPRVVRPLRRRHSSALTGLARVGAAVVPIFLAEVDTARVLLERDGGHGALAEPRDEVRVGHLPGHVLGQREPRDGEEQRQDDRRGGRGGHASDGAPQRCPGVGRELPRRQPPEPPPQEAQPRPQAQAQLPAAGRGETQTGARVLAGLVDLGAHGAPQTRPQPRVASSGQKPTAAGTGIARGRGEAGPGSGAPEACGTASARDSGRGGQGAERSHGKHRRARPSAALRHSIGQRTRAVRERARRNYSAEEETAEQSVR